MANYVKATNFTAKDSLPTGNSGKIVKGAELDTEYTAIASAIASKSDINSPTFTGTPAAPTASTGTNTTQLATTAFVNASILYAVPAGVITLWSGSIASVPLGWSLCNGSSGTPDLRDRFVVGAGTTYAVGATGGANTVTLDATMIPSHTHAISITTGSQSADHTHTGTTSSVSTEHTHTYSGTSSGQSVSHTHPTVGGIGNAQGGGGTFGAAYVQGTTHTSTSGVASVDHTHTYSGTTAAMSANASHTHTVTTGGVSAGHTHLVSGTSDATGGGLAHENRPPYYALAWIMKL